MFLFFITIHNIKYEVNIKGFVHNVNNRISPHSRIISPPEKAFTLERF